MVLQFSLDNWIHNSIMVEDVKTNNSFLLPTFSKKPLPAASVKVNITSDSDVQECHLTICKKLKLIPESDAAREIRYFLQFIKSSVN